VCQSIFNPKSKIAVLATQLRFEKVTQLSTTEVWIFWHR